MTKCCSSSLLFGVVLATICLSQLACIVSGQGTCEVSNDVNATYESEPCRIPNVTADCIVHKQCNDGYSFGMAGEGAQNLTCGAGGWIEEEKLCIACSFPKYGRNCGNTTGNCSSECPYTATTGCTAKPEKELWSNCDLNELELNVTESFAEILGLAMEENLTIVAQVNVVDNDVNVTVTFDTEVAELNHIGDGRYEHTVPMNTSSSGVYIFRAETNYSHVEKQTTVMITDPARIVAIYDSEGENVTKSSTVHVEEGVKKTWTCEATGIERPKVWWYFGGVRISEIELQDRLYQVTDYTENTTTTSTLHIHPAKELLSQDSGIYTCEASNGDGMAGGDVFRDLRTMNLVVGDSIMSIEEYVRKKDFLIAVVVLGIVLFITILVFGGVAFWFRKNNGDFNNSTPTKANRNDYMPDPVGTNGDAFDDFAPPLQRLQPAPQQESTSMKMARRQQASLPKPHQGQRPRAPSNDRPPEPGPRPGNNAAARPHGDSNPPIPRLPGMTVHRPVQPPPTTAQSPRAGGYYTSRPQTHQNPAFRNDANLTVYDEPGDDTYVEPEPSLPQRNIHQPPQRYHSEEPQGVYDEPAPEDNGLYEETLGPGAYLPPRRH